MLAEVRAPANHHLWPGAERIGNGASLGCDVLASVPIGGGARYCIAGGFASVDVVFTLLCPSSRSGD